MKTHTHTGVALLLTCRVMDDSLVDANIVAWQRMGEHQKEKERERDMEREEER